jgi:hypothetical protein
MEFNLIFHVIYYSNKGIIALTLLWWARVYALESNDADDALAAQQSAASTAEASMKVAVRQQRSDVKKLFITFAITFTVVHQAVIAFVAPPAPPPPPPPLTIKPANNKVTTTTKKVKHRGTGVTETITTTTTTIKKSLVDGTTFEAADGNTYINVPFELRRDLNVPAELKNPKCVKTSGNDFFCSDDPAELKLRADVQYYLQNYGAVQTIEGNGEENIKMRVVASDMETYMKEWIRYYEDVPSLKEKCMNRHDKCVFWASIQECKKNPGYMENDCMLACQKCEKLLEPQTTIDNKKYILTKTGYQLNDGYSN